MLDGLAEVPGMTLYGISDPARAGERTPTFTFTLPGITPREICEQLAERGILGFQNGASRHEALEHVTEQVELPVGVRRGGIGAGPKSDVDPLWLGRHQR